MTNASPQASVDRAHLGMGMMLGAWGFFSLVDTSVKWLVLAGLPAMQLAFVRYLGQLLITFMIGAGRMRLTEHLTTREFVLLSLRGLLLASATALNFWALKYLPLPLTASIMFSSPIFVALLSMPLLGERVGPWRWGAILAGFCGILVVIQPWGATFHWASIVIVYNALALALYSIITRQLAPRISAQTMQIFMGALGTVVLAPFAWVVWDMPQTGLDLGLMAALGLWAWAGHEIFARAHVHAPASLLMPFSYSFILYLSLASYLVWGDLPSQTTLAGGCIIVLSGLTIWWRERYALRRIAP